LQNFERKKLPENSYLLNDDPYIFFSHNLFIISVLAIGTLYSLIFCLFKVVYGIVFGVTPDIKIISFGVKQLKNRRVTPNGEEIKDEKRNFLHQQATPSPGPVVIKKDDEPLLNFVRGYESLLKREGVYMYTKFGTRVPL
jgi:hypothetical protein